MPGEDDGAGSIPERVAMLEVSVSTLKEDVSGIKEDIDRLEENIQKREDVLRKEIQENARDIKRIIENDISHINFELEELNAYRKSGRNTFFSIGSIAGLIGFIALVIKNGQVICKWLFDILSIFFG